ncbi:MAG: hypothetical protein M3Z33_10165 [Actinomycetota bacterium]|nr:hypothetical protein [Actinomycetota bacterium]
MSNDVYDEWHLAVSKELEARVKGRMFFVRVTVAPEAAAGGATSPAEVDEESWKGVAASVEEWLAGLDPDVVGDDNMPEHEVRPGGTPVELAALPKKEKRRGKDPLIVNPFPGIEVFTGTHTSGAVPVFDDGTEAQDAERRGSASNPNVPASSPSETE